MSEPVLAPEFLTMADAMKARVQAARRILVPTHINVDGDSLASVLALTRALQGMGKEVVSIITDGKVPPVLHFCADGSELVLYTGQPLPPTDLSFLVDITGLSRLGSAREELADRLLPEMVLNIDHHVSNERFGALNLVDSTAAATAELVYLLLRRWDVTITPALAIPLMIGLLTDTLSFQTSSTAPRTLRVGADLIEAGAPLEHLVTVLFRSKPFSSARLFGAIIAAARLEDRLLWSEVTPAMLEESGATPGETEGALSYLAGVDEAVIFALLYRQPDGWRASLRSNDARVDVARLAAQFGGGGHARAAGCTVLGGDEARDRFFAAAKATIAAGLATTATAAH